jgi:alpha-tubulin suppressor-like RCC1 family protein/Tol biopolymer transport system component/chitodextrinase
MPSEAGFRPLFIHRFHLPILVGKCMDIRVSLQGFENGPPFRSEIYTTKPIQSIGRNRSAKIRENEREMRSFMIDGMIRGFMSTISRFPVAGAAWMIAALILLTPPAALAQLAAGTDCGCTKTGSFVDPDPGKAPFIKADGDSATSSAKYRLTATPGGTNLPANVSIVRLADSATVLQTTGTFWGFSPDQDRFLIWWQTGSIFQANLYDLTGAAPNAPIRTFSGNFTSLRFRFSDNGRFLLLAGLVSGGAQVQLEYVNAATGDARLVRTLPIPATGSIETDVAGWGYGPDPSRIVYSYLSSGQPMVALDNLDDGSQAPLVEHTLGASAFWQFSPCGDVFGIVNQTAASQMQVDLWRTRDAGAVIGSTTFGSLDFVTLATTATKHQTIVPGDTRDLADNAAAVACPVNASPTADFSVSGVLEAGQTITFTDASSDTDGTIASRSWTFGDGATSSLQNPTHVYSAGGDFDVTLTVTDNGGATASRTKTLTLPLNLEPTADFSTNGTLEVGRTISFTDASSDTDGTIASWSWSFGDGGTSSSRNPTHVYSAAGAFSVKLTVTDNGGKTADRTQVLPICSAAVVSSGKILYRTGVTRGDLYALNMDSSGVVRITNSDQQYKGQVGDGSGDADYSPDGSKIAWIAAEQNDFVGSGSGLAVSNADGSGKVLLVLDASDFMTLSNPRWTPDGRAIAFYIRDVYPGPPRHGIYLIDADGSNMRLVHQAMLDSVADTATMAYPGGFSPVATCGPDLDGRIPDGCWTLAVGVQSWGPGFNHTRISKIQCGGSGVLTPITNGTADHSPRFSPDSARIAFSHGWTPEVLYVMNADGTAALPVGTHQPNTWDYDPVWSPDGSQIAFTRAFYPNSSSITQRDIIVTNADGCHGNAVAIGEPYKSVLSWAPGSQTQGTGSISGHVFYGGSLPNPSAGGITVTAFWSGGSRSAQTDADGNFTITEIPAGVDITSISANLPGYVWTSPGPLAGGTGYQFPGFTGQAYGVFLGMAPDRYTLNGTVKDPDGNPVPGIVIEATGQPTPIFPVTTGSDGSFSFDLLRPRLPYTLRPVTAGYDYTPPRASAWGDYGAVLTQDFVAAPIVPPVVTPPILFSSDRNSPSPPGDEKIFSIYAAEPNGSGTVRLTRGLASDSMPAWSPDGKKIVFVRQINGLNKLHVMAKDGTGLVILGIEGEWPDWSPGGTKIAYSRSGRIFVADADGMNETQLTAGSDGCPAWSRDGKRIAFERTDAQNGQIDIYAIELTTGSVSPLLVRSGNDQGPAWSADGQTLAVSFTNFYGDSGKLFTVSADGQTTTDLGVFGTDPTWSPDGRLAYTTDASSGTTEVLDIATGDRQAFPKPQDTSDAGPTWRVIIAPVENNFDVAVSGNNPWTDSGIDLKVGDQVSITAVGSIYFDYNGTAYGPEGPGNLDPWAAIDPDLPFQSLVGSIGDPTVSSPPTFFEIGGSYNFTATAAGRLWLGVNAADFGNNSGSWGVNIKVTVNPPPGPVVTLKSVNGTDRWTDSGIDFKTGDFVAIVAGGSVNFYYSQDGYSSPYGPAGPGYNDGSASIDPELPFQSLVGSIGDPSVLSPPAFFGIGSAYHFRATADGHLWLGVNAAEFANNSGSWEVTITLTPASVTFEPVAITTASSLPAGTVGVDYGSRTIETTGGSGDFTWSWWNTYDPQYGSIPAGLQLDPATGTISGTPTRAGNNAVTIQVHDNVYGMDVKQDFTLKVNAAVRMTTLWLPDGVRTAVYSESLNAAYGAPPYTWEIVTGTLPSGLNLVGDRIGGTPDVSAGYNFAVRVTDALGTTDRRDLTITVVDPALKIVTAGLLPGVVGQDYSQTLQGAYAAGTLQWALNSGSLPPGLALDGNGHITGKPTKAGRYPFQVRLAGGSEAVNQEFSIQIHAAGIIWAWGYGSNGQLGTGEKTDRNTPVQGNSSTGLAAAVGADPGSIHSLAVDAAGQVWSWGGGGNGQLGRPAAAAQNSFPGKVVTTAGDNLGNIVLISAGNLQGGMAVDKAGLLWVWGDNQQGQLGNGTDSFSRNSADVVPGLTNVVAVSSSKSGYHSLAVTAGGEVWAWGWNSYGQVGNGDFTPDGSDIHVSTPARVQGLMDIVAVAAGSVHSLALDKFGRVWAWGGNTSGQLGLGTTDSNYPAHLLPVLMPGLSHITAISAGPVYSLALDDQGHLWAWGSNWNGEMGLGSVSASVSSPSMVPSLDGLVSVSSGSNFVIASDSHGSAWTWGRNYYGQLGDGNSGSGHDTTTPHSLISFNGIRAVAGGNMHALALKAIAPGDLNGDGSVNLLDAIAALQISSRMDVAAPVYLSTDVDGDGRVGLAEVIYILQRVVEMRP